MKNSGILLVIVVFFSKASFAQTNCAMKLERDSIKIYTCDLPGSNFKAVKASFQVRSSLSQLAAMILDIDHYGAWQYKTLSARILNKISEREIIYYTEIIAPVLTNNRDFVIQLTISQNPHSKEMIIDAVTIPGHVIPKENVIRVSYSKARWTVKPLASNLLQVDYYIELDLGGSAPPWLVNLVAPQAPYETFKDLKEKIGNYKGSNVLFIRD